jgi:hypothetical protein
MNQVSQQQERGPRRFFGAFEDTSNFILAVALIDLTRSHFENNNAALL